jgi:hypothetical protein
MHPSWPSPADDHGGADAFARPCPDEGVRGYVDRVVQAFRSSTVNLPFDKTLLRLTDSLPLPGRETCSYQCTQNPRFDRNRFMGQTL